MHHLGCKTESYTYQVVKFQVHYEVAPVVRPIFSVDLLTSKGVLSRFRSWSTQFVHATAVRTQYRNDR